MGFKFRKSVKIAPGVKLNFNKKSTGVTFGGKGFHYTVNSKGKRTTSVGVPGTGLYYSNTSGGNKSNSSKNKSTDNQRSFPWYLNVLFFLLLIALIVVLIVPIAIYYIWAKTDWQKSTKAIVTSVIVALSAVFLIVCATTDIPEGSETTTEPQTTIEALTNRIEAFEFSRNKFELEEGGKVRSWVRVEGTENFSIDDIIFVSSDESVATFEYETTSLDTYLYFYVKAVSPGTATIYVETADGRIQSDKIPVTVLEAETTESETTSQKETTTKENTTAKPTTTQKATTTKPIATTATNNSGVTHTQNFTSVSKPETEKGEYVLNTNTMKIHYPQCNSVDKIALDNYATTKDYDWAIVQGYVPCKKCNPLGD